MYEYKNRRKYVLLIYILLYILHKKDIIYYDII